jgi:hypothetical protein
MVRGAMSDDVVFEAEEIDEYALGDTEQLPLPYVRQSRLIYPRGPFNSNWIEDQIGAGNIRNALLVPRDKLYGIRLIDLRSILSLLDALAGNRPGEKK